MTNLYRHKDGALVSVIKKDDEQVQFCAAGGGFLATKSRASFDSDFRPEENVGPYKEVHVMIEGHDKPLRAYANEMRWNGWVMPFFTPEVAHAMAADFQLSFNPQKNCFVAHHDEEEFYEQSAIDVDGQAVLCYGIGAGSWVWEMADAPSDQPRLKESGRG